MSVIFFVPLTMVAFYETVIKRRKRDWMTNWLHDDSQGDELYSESRDPDVDAVDAAAGLSISKVPFTELIKVFPNTEQVCALCYSKLRSLC